MSLRDTILQSDDRQEEVVTVPEWGDAEILLRGMSGRQRGKFVEQIDAKQREFMYADILIELAYDPKTGEHVFDRADREALSDKSGAVLDRLAGRVIELSGVNVAEAEEDVKADPT